MTKRTEKLVLSVFEFCVKAALKAQREGILALEYLRLEKGLTESGEIVFSRKVDKYLAWMIGSIIDGGYSLEANTNYVKSLSKHSSKRTKLLLDVAFACMDCIANGIALEKLVVFVSANVGIEMQKKLWNLLNELQVQNAKDFEFKLTEEQKDRIKQTNVYFKMKEDECKTLLRQKNKKLCELHLRVPELKNQAAYVKLVYKPKGRHYDETMYACYIPELNTSASKHSSEFIGEIPVCDSMWSFWDHESNCARDIKKFMMLTEDIPNNIENYLVIQSKMKLQDSDSITFNR